MVQQQQGCRDIFFIVPYAYWISIFMVIVINCKNIDYISLILILKLQENILIQCLRKRTFQFIYFPKFLVLNFCYSYKLHYIFSYRITNGIMMFFSFCIPYSELAWISTTYGLNLCSELLSTIGIWAIFLFSCPFQTFHTRS